MPDIFDQLASKKKAGDIFDQLSNKRQVVPQDILDKLSAQNNTYQGYQAPKQPLPDVGFFAGVRRAASAIGGAPYDIAQAATPQNPQQAANYDTSSPLNTAISAVKTGFQNLVSDPMQAEAAKARQGGPGSTGHAIASGIPLIGPMAANLGERVGNRDFSGAAGEGLIQAIAGKAGAEAGPEVSKTAADISNAVRNRPINSPAVNFSAALNEGGKLPGAIRTTEDVAAPIVDKFRENWSKLGYTDADAIGPEAHTKMANAARATVADIETQGQRYKGVIGGMKLNGLQNELAGQIESSRPVTTDPGINDAWGRIADKVRNAKTYNDLFELKSDLNKLTSGKSFGNVTSDASGAMDAAADAGDVLRKGINQGVKQITGTDIEPLMKQEQAAIRAQTLAEKAEPNLSRELAKNQTVGYGKRLRSGETSLETLKQAVGKGRPTGYELFQDRLKRTVAGASAGSPPVQGPLGPFSGQYVRNSPYGPNPGQPGVSGLPESTPVTTTPTSSPSLRKLLGLR
jgi:hypothetical protein